MKFIAGALGVLALIILIAGIALAMTCPDEAQLRKSVYGEMEPRYKFVLETVGRASKLAGGPCILYHNHFVYSTLDFRMLDGSEIRLANGAAGKIWLTPNVKDVKELILAIPGVETILGKGESR
jgi:hypothetical protein